MIRNILAQHPIYSMGKNKNGRTPMITIMCNGTKRSIVRGEVMDSPADYAAMQEINAEMKVVHREFLIKNARSEERARNTFLNA